MSIRGIKFVLGMILICSFLATASAQIPTIMSRKTGIDRELDTVSKLMRAGEFERAISYLDHLKQSLGDDPKITSMYKRVYAEAKMYPQLETIIEDQLRQKPGDELLLAELGNAKFLLDDAKAADSLWKLVLNSGSTNSTAYSYVANYKLRYGDYDGAAAAYLKGRSVLGIDWIFSYELAGVYEAQRKYPEAVEEMLRYVGKSSISEGPISSRIAGFIEDSDNPDEIVRAVRNGVQEFSSDKKMMAILGDVYIKIGDMSRALETFRKMGIGLNDDGASLVFFAERCFENKVYSTAIEAVDEYFKTTKKGLNNDRALLIKGRAQQMAGRIDDSVVTFSKLSQSAKDRNIREQADYLLGLVYAEDLGDCAAALQVWNELAENGRVVDVRDMAEIGMASCYLRMDRFPVAESILADLVDKRGAGIADQKALFLLGEIYFVKGEYDRATEAYENLARISPGDDYANDALERLGILSATGPDSSALDMFGEGLKEMNMRHLSKAAEIFSDSVLTNSSLAEQAMFFSASILDGADDVSEAIDGYKKYIERFPEGTYADRAYFGLGNLYLRNKETHSLARAAFSTILERFPDGPVVEQAREKLRELESENKIG